MPKLLDARVKKSRQNRIIGWMAEGRTLAWMGRQLGLSREWVRCLIVDDMGFLGYKSYRLKTEYLGKEMKQVIRVLNKSLTGGEAARKLGWSQFRLKTFITRFELEDKLALNFKDMPGPSEMTVSQRKHMWDKIEKTKTCWVWHGFMADGAYPLFRTTRSKVYFIKRVLYQLHLGSYLLPSDKKLYNTCGNARCCNPGHHSLGRKSK